MLQNQVNQVYRKAKTMNDHPEVYQNYRHFTKFCLEHHLIKMSPEGQMRVKGRRYDLSLIVSLLPIKDKVICEVGARDSLMGSYLSREAQAVHLLDNFEGWGKGTSQDLGQIETWTQIWKSSAFCPEKLTIKKENIIQTSYPDNSFDLIICTGVLEHLSESDQQVIKELVRICKPEGFICISTTLAQESGKIGGTFLYTESLLFQRIIEPSGCHLYGDSYDFDLENRNNDNIFQVGDHYPVSNLFFILQKPSAT